MATARQTTNWYCKGCGDVLNGRSVADHECKLRMVIEDRVGWREAPMVDVMVDDQHITGTAPDAQLTYDGRVTIERDGLPLWTTQHPLVLWRGDKVSLPRFISFVSTDGQLEYSFDLAQGLRSGPTRNGVPVTQWEGNVWSSRNRPLSGCAVALLVMLTMWGLVSLLVWMVTR